VNKLKNILLLNILILNLHKTKEPLPSFYLLSHVAGTAYEFRVQNR
jgi:hypothetical protein